MLIQAPSLKALPIRRIAECFGWPDSAQDWMTYRKLRHQMVHEYIEDNAVLADAPDAGRMSVPVLASVARRVSAEARSASLKSLPKGNRRLSGGSRIRRS